MNYSTYLNSRWHVYSCGGELDANGRVTKDNDKLVILHLKLEFKILDVLYDVDNYVNVIIVMEEFKSGIKVKYKEKIELRKYIKNVCKDYIKNRLAKGFEHELFTVK